MQDVEGRQMKQTISYIILATAGAMSAFCLWRIWQLGLGPEFIHTVTFGAF